jgi:hypothetical protein
LLGRELEILEGLSIHLESLWLIGKSNLVVLVREKLLLDLRRLKDVLEFVGLTITFSVFLFVLQLQRPVVVLAVAKDSFHVVQCIFVKARGVYNARNAALSRAGDFRVLDLALQLVLIFREIFFDEAIELVGLGPVTSVWSWFAHLLIFVGKDLFEASAFVYCVVFVTMTALEALELGL